MPDMEIATLGAATKIDVARWLGVSRNTVADLLADMDIAPIRKKYPWRRLLSGVLRLEAPLRDPVYFLDPLMSLAEAAEELGMSAADVRQELKGGNLATTPVYNFSQRSTRLIRRQILEFSCSPRNQIRPLDLFETGLVEGSDPDRYPYISMGGKLFAYPANGRAFDDAPETVVPKSKSDAPQLRSFFRSVRHGSVAIDPTSC